MQFLYFTIFWFVGIWLGSTAVLADVPAWLSGVAGLGFAGVGLFFARSYRYYAPQMAFACGCLAAVALGSGRWQMAQPVIDEGHVAFYNGSRLVTIYGRAIDEPDIRDRSVNLRVRVVEIELADGTTHEVEGDILVQTPRFPIVEYGTDVVVIGDLLAPPENNEFSYRDYLANQGIYSLMTWPRMIDMDSGQGNPVYHAIYAAKADARDTIQTLIPDPEAGLLSGILLGIAHATPPSVDEDFRTVGITHIVVISGFNIAILSVIFLNLLTPVMGRQMAAYGTIGAIALYTVMVGADTAVVRAAIMGGLFVLADRVLGRPNAPLTSLFVAGWIMTVHDPRALWDVGFQLSFVATLSLMLYAEPMTQWARRGLAKWLDGRVINAVLPVLSDAVLITIAAQILTLPLLMYYFQQLSLISLFANMLVLPAQPAVMILGGLATLLGMAWLPLGRPFAWVATLFLRYTIRTAEAFAQIPYALIDIEFSFGALLFFYVVIGGWTLLNRQEPERKAAVLWQLRRRLGQRVALGGSALCLLLAGQWVTTQPDGLLHVIFFDVGQGDAIFIQTPNGRQVLVDGGYYPTILNAHLGRTMPAFDRQLDMVVATHPDADHVSGLPGVFKRYTVERLLVSELPDGDGAGRPSAVYVELIEAAEKQETALYRPMAGETIVLDEGVRLEVLHPASELLPDGRNDNSISFRLVYGDFSLLLTGDAEVAGEEAMLASGRPLQSLIFKAGHHGANNASTMPFLEAVRPRIIIVSSGVDNRFGHPHPDMLARAQAVGATVLRTDELGTLAVKTDGGQMWWTASK